MRYPERERETQRERERKGEKSTWLSCCMFCSGLASLLVFHFDDVIVIV